MLWRWRSALLSLVAKSLSSSAQNASFTPQEETQKLPRSFRRANPVRGRWGLFDPRVMSNARDRRPSKPSRAVSRARSRTRCQPQSLRISRLKKLYGSRANFSGIQTAPRAYSVFNCRLRLECRSSTRVTVKHRRANLVRSRTAVKWMGATGVGLLPSGRSPRRDSLLT